MLFKIANINKSKVLNIMRQVFNKQDNINKNTINLFQKSNINAEV